MLLALILSLLSQPVFAQQPWTEDYGPVGSDTIPIAGDEDYRWLFEKLFPEDLRRAHPDESFKSFRVHLRDTHKEFPAPEKIILKNLKLVPQVQGRITYAGIVSKKYIYDILENSPSDFTINVRVHLTDATIDDWDAFTAKMKAAENTWNGFAPPTDFKYNFKFDIVRDPKQAHFSVRVLDSTRGPYDTNWGRNWNSTTIAHEIGHMMGLGDEYQTVSGKIDCFERSLMCHSWYGAPMPHHYYFILRRLCLSPN
jgi:hypothetical protein